MGTRQEAYDLACLDLTTAYYDLPSVNAYTAINRRCIQCSQPTHRIATKSAPETHAIFDLANIHNVRNLNSHDLQVTELCNTAGILTSAKTNSWPYSHFRPQRPNDPEPRPCV